MIGPEAERAERLVNAQPQYQRKTEPIGKSTQDHSSNQVKYCLFVEFGLQELIDKSQASGNSLLNDLLALKDGAVRIWKGGYPDAGRGYR